MEVSLRMFLDRMERRMPSPSMLFGGSQGVHSSKVGFLVSAVLNSTLVRPYTWESHELTSIQETR